MLDEENGMFYLNGKTIQLSNLETALFGYLIKHKNKIVSYKEAAERIYQKYNRKTKSNVVMLAYRINKKIGQKIIKARNQLGYKLVWEVKKNGKRKSKMV